MSKPLFTAGDVGLIHDVADQVGNRTACKLWDISGRLQQYLDQQVNSVTAVSMGIIYNGPVIDDTDLREDG